MGGSIGDELRAGDRANVVVSPYSSVPVSTMATIESVKQNHFGPGRHLYILAGLPHQHFGMHELRRACEVVVKAP